MRDTHTHMQNINIYIYIYMHMHMQISHEPIVAIWKSLNILIQPKSDCFYCKPLILYPCNAGMPPRGRTPQRRFRKLARRGWPSTWTLNTTTNKKRTITLITWCHTVSLSVLGVWRWKTRRNHKISWNLARQVPRSWWFLSAWAWKMSIIRVQVILWFMSTLPSVINFPHHRLLKCTIMYNYLAQLA